jgi:hypothetical protein
MIAVRNSSSFRTLFRQVIAGALVLMLNFVMNDASACAACGDTLSKDWESQGISSQPGFTADVSYDYLNQNKQRYGTGAASSALINNQLAAGQEVEAYTRTQTVTASLIYNEDTWGVGVMLPYVMRSHGTYGTTAPLGSSYASSADASIGDLRVVGRYTGLSSERTSGIIAGIKLPTGSTGKNFDAGTAAGTPLDAGLQVGTGSTDIILGAYTTGTIDTYGWFLQGTVQHAVATRQALGNLDYRPGDAYLLNTGIRYAGFGAKVSPMLQLNVIRRQADSGAPDALGNRSVPIDPVTGVPVSGGTLAYLAPGVSVRVGGGASVYGFVQIPIYQNVNSLQLTPGYTLTMGVRQSF